MHKHTYLHGFLTALSVGVLTFLFFMQAKVVLKPVPIEFVPPQIAFGYANTLNSACAGSLRGYWKFDEESGIDVRDWSQNGNIGTLTGDASRSTGTASTLGFYNPRAGLFDGNGDYVDISEQASTLSLTTSGTVAGWFLLSGAVAEQQALVMNASDTGSTAGYGLYYGNLGTGAKFTFFVDSDGMGTPFEKTVDSTILATGSWVHIAGTWNASGVRIYQSGALAAAVSGAVSAYDSLSVYLGGGVTNIEDFRGKMDDVRIYAAALTGGQILELARGNHPLIGCTCGDGTVQKPEACDDGNTSNTDSCLNICVAAVCGDGIVSGTEACDNGDDNSDSIADACRTDCTAAKCGDGVTDTNETCDDGNTSNTDSCTNSCANPSCGDGTVQTNIGEQCEPPNTTTCDSNCKTAVGGGGTSNRRRRDDDGGIVDQQSSYSRREPPPEGCGDRITQKEKGEECDEGQWNGTGVCSYTCKLLYCGDGIVSPELFEHCEPESTGEVDGIPQYEQETCSDDGVVCSVPTIDERTGVVRGGCQFLFVKSCDQMDDTDGDAEPECGNGILEFGEACDDGNLDDEDGCSAECRTEAMEEEKEAECGNGELEEGEWCDDGNTENGDGCSSTCTLEKSKKEPTCGDGSVNGSEECDDGNTVGGDGCSERCTKEGFCGDGRVSGQEQCDDGNDDDTDSCTSDCRVPVREIAMEPEPYCGDGFFDEGEQCDDGEDNSDILNDACRMDCTLPVCGDAVVDSGEECDNGADNSNIIPDACRTNCTVPFCGDGTVDSSEQCDSSVGCLPNCRFEAVRCGNGVLDDAEECDDGNTLSGDGCNFECLAEKEPEVVASEPKPIPPSLPPARPITPVPVPETPPVTPQPLPQYPTVYALPPVQPIAAQLMSPLPIQEKVLGDTGPAAFVFLATGSALGFVWKRRRKKRDA